MTEEGYKYYLVDVRQKVIENADALLKEAITFYEKGDYQRATFLAMTCIEECGKLSLLRNLGLVDKSKFQEKKKEINSLLRDHTGKALESAVNSFFINSGADRRQGTNKNSGISNSDGLIILARSRRWMEWRNSCLYVDINIANEESKTPVEEIGKKEACYYIRIGFEVLAENAENGYGLVDPWKVNPKGTQFWEAKLEELGTFMEKNKDVDVDNIDFLSNPDEYRKLYKDK